MPEMVDARGLACPQPVVLTKRALEKYQEIIVVVDNPASRDNVRRFAETKGFEVDVEEREGAFYLHIKGKGEKEEKVPQEDLVLVVSGNIMGKGDEELGNVLMRSFMHTLTELDRKPRKMIFFNTGVKLAVEGSEVLEDLKALEKEGVEILVCGTCLSFFNLKEKIKVGQVSNMYTIAETMISAGKLVFI